MIIMGTDRLATRSSLLVLFLVALLAAARERAGLWCDQVSLWEDAAAKSPDKSRTYNNLGMAYYNNKRPDDALRAFRRSLDLNPDNGMTYGNLGQFYFDRAIAEGDPLTMERAIEYFQYAEALRPGDPVTRGFLDKARRHWQELRAARGH